MQAKIQVRVSAENANVINEDGTRIFRVKNGKNEFVDYDVERDLISDEPLFREMKRYYSIASKRRGRRRAIATSLPLSTCPARLRNEVSSRRYRWPEAEAREPSSASGCGRLPWRATTTPPT